MISLTTAFLQPPVQPILEDPLSEISSEELLSEEDSAAEPPIELISRYSLTHLATPEIRELGTRVLIRPPQERPPLPQPPPPAPERRQPREPFFGSSDSEEEYFHSSSASDGDDDVRIELRIPTDDPVLIDELPVMLHPNPRTCLLRFIDGMTCNRLIVTIPNRNDRINTFCAAFVLSFLISLSAGIALLVIFDEPTPSTTYHN